MVAPAQRPEWPTPSPSMRRAHELVAATLLTPQPPPAEHAPPVPAWRAWLFAAWAAAAAWAYLLHWLGLW